VKVLASRPSARVGSRLLPGIFLSPGARICSGLHSGFC
jgi:hypothetical protein